MGIFFLCQQLSWQWICSEKVKNKIQSGKKKTLIDALLWTHCPTVYHPHRSVSYSAPYWKCIIDHLVHTKRKPADILKKQPPRLKTLQTAMTEVLRVMFNFNCMYPLTLSPHHHVFLSAAARSVFPKQDLISKWVIYSSTHWLRKEQCFQAALLSKTYGQLNDVAYTATENYRAYKITLCHQSPSWSIQ